MRHIGTRAAFAPLAWLALAFAALLLPFAGPAAAQGPPAPDYQRLGLSADQMTRVRDLHTETYQAMRTLEGQLREQRRALETAYGEFKLDTARVRQLNNRINEIQRDLLEKHTHLQVELRKILTADQFQRLRTMMGERRNHGRSRPQPRKP